MKTLRKLGADQPSRTQLRGEFLGGTVGRQDDRVAIDDDHHIVHGLEDFLIVGGMPDDLETAFDVLVLREFLFEDADKPREVVRGNAVLRACLQPFHGGIRVQSIVNDSEGYTCAGHLVKVAAPESTITN